MSNHTVLNLPKHRNPVDANGNLKPNRTASAPYNFVPLPEVVVTVVDDANDWPDHDRYHPKRHTGYFEVTLTTKSPLYVRCPFTRDEFDLDEQDKDRNGHKVDNQTRYADRIKNTPHFFYTRDPDQPLIPGSSLRGILRSVLEIVSYGKVQWVTDKNLFFRRENGQLTFFGRAQMFRLPYSKRPIDLVPTELRRPEDIDYAEALFGFVRTKKELDDMNQRGVIQEIPKQGDKRRAYAGRVYVTDAGLVEGQPDFWLSDDPITPNILATPKPTAFQHYLTQQQPNNKNQLDHYDSPPPHETVIRGYKRYWHQGLNPDEGLTFEQIREQIEDERARLGQLAATSTQHTQFKPIKPGVKFTFRVYFENLSDRELGALCWTLHPLGGSQKEYCHHLGMGKPLGMGAVKLEATLHLTDHPTRYALLFDGDKWQTGTTGSGEALADRSTLERRTHEFEQHVLSALRLNTTCQRLFELKRIGMLLKMMEWPGFRPVLPPAPSNRVVTENGRQRPNTRYMTIQPNEYRDRPVLPNPQAFGGLTGEAEPASSDTSASGGGLTTHRPSHDLGSSPPVPSPPKGASQASPKAQKPKSRQAKATTKKELVTLVEGVKGGKAKVQTEEGEIIVCGNFPPYPQAAAGMRCRAEVTRQDGKAQRAIFKGWK